MYVPLDGSASSPWELELSVKPTALNVGIAEDRYTIFTPVDITFLVSSRG